MQYRTEQEKTVRLKDLAVLAGVSPTTISNVIHGRTEKVSQATVERVRRLLEETGYVSGMAPRMLSGGGSRLVGVLVGGAALRGTGRTRQAALLGDLERELYRRNYYMMPHLSDSPEEQLRFASVWNVEGLITLGLKAEENRKLQEKLGVPVVSIDTYYGSDPPVANVGTDVFAGGYRMGNHLLNMGHREIRFLADSDEEAACQCWRGLQKACAEFGLALGEDEWIRVPEQSKQRRAFYKRNLAALACRSDALFFASDFLAAEAEIYLQDMGFGVPEQVSVAGFGDEEYALLGRPRLTTIRQDGEKKAGAAAQKLLELIRGDGGRASSAVLPVRLIRRDSVMRRHREQDLPERT